MPVRIRLRRVGRKAQPYYRVVVTDSEAPRDGAYLEAVGFYNPRLKPAELRLDLERVDTWVGKGANLSDTVASLVRKARRGGDRTVALKPLGGEPKAEGATVVAAPARKGGRKAKPAAAPPAEAPPADEPAAES